MNKLRPEPVAVLTDYDLDGAGSFVILRHAYNVEVSKHQGYAKLQQNLEAIYEERPDINTLVIADISVPPESLQWAMRHYSMVILYDHHLPSEKYVELAKACPDQFQIYWNDKLCSCALVYQSMVTGTGYRTPELDRFVQGVQAYDVWDTESPYFERGIIMNDMFWEDHMQGFKRRFKDGFDEFSELEKSKAAALAGIRKGVLERALVEELESGSQIVMIDDPSAVNFVSLYSTKGYVFYVLYPNKGTGKIHMSARLKGNNPGINFNQAVENLKEKQPDYNDIIVRAGGHAGSIGVQFQDGITPNQMADWIIQHLDPEVRALEDIPW